MGRRSHGLDPSSDRDTCRRCGGILASDGADEEGTHERSKAHRRELVDPKIREHQGHIVKTTGDGMLVEFASVVDAVRCAAEVQRGMIDRELEVREERRVKFRISVNLGDSDGVNVAARLEALAEPGGICISRMVRDQIRDKCSYLFEDLGEQSVKNVARPVLFDPDWQTGDRLHEVGRTRFGPIAIANSDSAAAAYTDAAIDQAHRAVQELLAG